MSPIDLPELRLRNAGDALERLREAEAQVQRLEGYAHRSHQMKLDKIEWLRRASTAKHDLARALNLHEPYEAGTPQA